MLDVLQRSAAFLFIIVLGYVLKRVGLFGKTDYKIVTKIILNITLPAAVITSFSSYEPEASVLFCVLFGLLFNILSLCLALPISRKKPLASKAIWLNSSSGGNIGAFALPFVQSFLPPVGVVATCLFDVGNAIMCTGGTYALTSGLVSGEKTKPSQILRKLLSSTPFITYVLMLILTLTGIRIPGGVIEFISPIARANPFLAMLMVGLMFDISLDRSMLKNATGVLLLRFGLSVAAAVGCYFLLPLPMSIRKALCICVFAPVSVAATAFSEKAGGSSTEAGFINSVSILISIAGIITMLTLFGSV